MSLGKTVQEDSMDILTCDAVQSNMNALILGTLCIASIIFLTLMSFLEHRSAFKLSCCNGRPGLVVPLNLLDGYENRLAYSLAFGVTTSYCISIIFNDAQSVLGSSIAKIIKSSPSYVNIFFKMIATILLATGAYPLFVCIGTRHRTLGSTFGFIFSATWFSLFCYKISKLFRNCYEDKKELLALVLAKEVPQYICLILLMLHFSRAIFTSIRARRCFRNQNEVPLPRKDDYMYNYVMALFKKQQYPTLDVNSHSSLIGLLTKTIKRKLYKSEFKFSTRVVCTFMVSSVAVYMLTVNLLGIAWILLETKLEPLIDSSNLNRFFGQSFVIEARKQVRIWTFCCYVSIMVSTIKTYIVFLNMLSWYRRHLMKLRVGDRSWLPESIKRLNDSPASLADASMKYAGYQVAYVAWGYWIFLIVFWLLLGLTSSLIFYPLFHGTSSVLIQAFYKVWPALLITVCIFLAERITARYCFLFKKGKIIAITNRKVFNIVSYYLFFFNIFLGFLSCLLRILKSVVVGVMFLERVQKSILPSSFEVIDPGYYAYIGCIHIEHTLANPVLRVFLDILNESVDCKTSSNAENIGNFRSNSRQSLLGDNECGIALETERYRIIRNKWNLAYTLIKNPSLLQFRKNKTNKRPSVESEYRGSVSC
ncbi:stimulated by retinoic acid gene 6 protein-like isoform X2 [Rhopilema esculentum]|uniref:stimulated by retinoic acid gene 6 protein-like isoform X2 n=1 Tax=Rhopilema esculentum TaxID=499914 RepID=UPI0031DA0305